MSLKSWFEPTPPPQEDELSSEEQQLLTKVAQKVIDWRMAVPAILFLESVKPLNYIGAQTMVFLEPFVQAIFDVKNYNLFRRMMEKRENIERLLQKIEELDAIQLEKERQQKRKLKAERKAKRQKFFRKLFGRELPKDRISSKQGK